MTINRILANILDDLDSFDRAVPAAVHADSEAAYGADLLGRAIGHEFAGKVDCPDIFAEAVAGWRATHIVMASMSAREV